MKNHNISKVVKKSWFKAKAFYINEPAANGIFHIALVIANFCIQDSVYLYIHDEMLSEYYAQAKGNYHWTFMRGRMCRMWSNGRIHTYMLSWVIFVI